MPVPEIAPDVARHLATRRWPGNLRQLRQKIEEALVFCDGHRLRVADFARGEGSLAAVLAETPPAGLAPVTDLPVTDLPATALVATALDATALDALAPVDAPPTHSASRAPTCTRSWRAASAPEAAAARRRGPPRQSATASSGSRIATRRRRPSAASPASAADKCGHSAAGASATKPSLA